MNRKISTNGSSGAENPRFLYFVVTELIINPLTNCPSYPQLVSALYRKTI